MRKKKIEIKRQLLLLIVCLFLLGAAIAHSQEISGVKNYPSPFLMTSAGQSPDVLMVKIVAEREKLDFAYEALAETADVGGNKTLLLVMGVSMKGLGSAGIKLDEEIARVDRIIAEARSNDMGVIGMFAGGAGGRGGRDELTDSIISEVAPNVDYLVVIKSGDKDGFLKGIAEDNSIPLTYMNTIVDMTKIVPQIFQ